MAILDRPLFQRRLTKDQLRRYGLPAFANGGIVQKFENGGDVTIPSGYQMSQAPFTQTVGSTSAMDTITDPRNYTSLVEKGMGMAASGLKLEISKLEAIIASPEMYSEAQVADAKARLPELKKQLADQEAKIVEGVTKEDMVTEKDEAPKKDTETDATGTITDKDPEKEITEEEDEMSRLKTLTLERSALYKEMLGDPRQMMRQQGLLDLAQFGLNLASARGGNLAEKIAKSAADPLASFAKLAQDSSRDARAIDLAALQAAEEELMLEKKLAAEDTDQNKIIIFNEAVDKNLNPVKTAEQTQILPAAKIKEIDNFRDETGKISSKLLKDNQVTNEFFYDTDGKVYKIKPGATKEKYLSKDDFEEIDPNIEIIGAN